MKKTISEEDICMRCKHKRRFHIGEGCNHGRWGRNSYPCMCVGFKGAAFASSKSIKLEEDK